MGTIADDANDVYRDFVTDGVPASGPNDPSKSDIRGLFGVIDQLVGGAISGATPYATASALPASTGSGKIYLVTSDPTTANNGYWQDQSGGNTILTALNNALKGAPGTLAAATNSDLTAGTSTTLAVTPEGLSYLGLTSALAAAVTGVQSTGGIYPTTDGTGTLTAGRTVFSQTAFSQAGVLTAASVFSAGAGAATLAIVNINGDGTVSLATDSAGNVLTKAVTLAAGANTFTNWNPLVASGQYLAVYSATALIRLGAGSGWYTTGLPATATSGGTAKTSTNGPRLGWTLDSSLTAKMAKSLNDIASLTTALANTLGI